ncbi:hypothetical protein [Novosphingobium pokkalii]|uniref:Uncharacterized protein n=1 Tax=Novosphingobium pokkalii TaxID=1770194 RepID=A0ABV7V0C0_9SPHN|nr:hypothetical protein [Novosphingobium pokkalii]GHC85335.1 hypothetical protein GCM10019060_05980 [Novosphingobium pokkalii]
MTGATRNPPFGLDLSFDEALARFIQTDRNEALAAEVADGRSIRGSSLLTWQKSLSTTDAQQPTKGGIVPYLRLTSGNISTGIFQTWFRQTLFANAAWQPGQFNGKPVEEAHIPLNVTIQGIYLGMVLFKVTHDSTRQDNNDAPNTWLHWPDQIATILHNNNFSGHVVTVTRDNAGVFSLTIQ